MKVCMVFRVAIHIATWIYGRTLLKRGKEGERRQTVSEADTVQYPQPEFAIAIRPIRHVMLRSLVDDYRTQPLELVLRTLLGTYAPGRGQYFILPHNTFDLWHKLSLCHPALLLAPNEGPHHNVTCVWPLDQNTCGRVHDPGVFKTTLVLCLSM
jgi:hypothetical protein